MYIMAKITQNNLTCFANEIFDTECVLHLNVRCQLKTISLRFWKRCLDSKVSLFLIEGCHFINSFYFVLKQKLCFVFQKMRSEYPLQFGMTPSQTHIPGGHDPVARRSSKRTELCSLKMIFEDVFPCRTRGWTWPSLVISDLFPVEHVQTPGGQASLETWDVLTLASKPPSCWDVLRAAFNICFKIFLFLWTHIFPSLE